MDTPGPQQRTFALYANSGGCPQNQLDGAQAYNYLVSNGYAYTSSLETADVILINSCAYRSEKEDQSVAKVLDAVQLAKHDALILVSGCLPKIAPRRLNQLDSNVFVIPGTELHRLEELVPPAHSPWSRNAAHSIPGPVFAYVKPFRRFLSSSLRTCRNSLPHDIVRHFDRLFMYDHSPETFLIRAAQGCLGNCTYCAIRFSRGRLKSKPLEGVLDEVRIAVRSGVKEILLSATDLAAYGRDIGTDVSVLLREALRAAPNQYLLLFYANPRWMIDIWDRLEPAFASQRIHFVHLSLNGGSDHVLARMGRGYTLREFETLIQSLNRVSPSTVLQTQIITGFPGETDDDFHETVRFFKRNYFHNVQVHAFDPRPGTVAAGMGDQIPLEVRQRRRRQLYALTLWRKLRYDAEYLATGAMPTAWRGQ
jgi:MiaB/RimO family radical SAM methylthiotransferase